MAIYAIGDIQGCFDELRRLLDVVHFDPLDDRLWFTGDLVNRGPKSLETLRFVKSLGSAAVTVLGNHDLHLLAIAATEEEPRQKDSLEAILAAPDRDTLLQWLRWRPLLHLEGDWCLVHAGLPPQWDLVQARRHAAEVEAVLQSDDHGEFFRHMYGDTPDLWSEEIQGWDRIRFITNCFTRMRYCDRDGRLDLIQKGAPGTQPAHLMPWFEVPERRSIGAHILFGHWSTLKFHVSDNCIGLDTGCLWGGQLTALKIGDPPQRISIDCPCFNEPTTP